MQKVTRFQDKRAQAALEHLEQAWAYYTPEPLVTHEAAAAEYDQQECSIVPYYTAA